jgi:glutamine amidotransferase
MGNLRSVQKAFELVCANVKVSSSAEDIYASDKIVLPGVGAFGKAMEELEKRKLIKPMLEFIEKGKPFLGICLGFQLLFSRSEEARGLKGLDILEGKVKRFRETKGLKIPHMGWNRIGVKRKVQSVKILEGVPDGAYMYFVHSYYAEPEDGSIVLCQTDYGGKFASGIHKDNIYAFQFHPEKSQGQGLKIIKNFVEL